MEGLKALLVDDELELASTMAERLGLRNIEADVVAGGDEAIEKVKNERYDVVVLDVVLWKARGFDVLKEMKSIRPELPVILLSGRASENDFEEGKQQGAFDYLVKPVHIEDLIDKMNQAIGAG